MHARTSSPSSSTEHAPHCAIPQPRRGPVNFSSLRSTNSKGVSDAADTTCFAPFTDSVSSFPMTLPPEQPDFTALRAASDPTCRHTELHEPFLCRKYSEGIQVRFGLLLRGISIVRRRVPYPNWRDYPGVEIPSALL